MLPARTTPAGQALQTLERLRASETETRLRVVLVDGSMVEGDLVALSDGHLSLGQGEGPMRYIPADQITRVQRGTRRTLREFVVAAVMIAGVTGVLVGAAGIPFLRAHLMQTAAWSSLFAYATIMQLRRRTPLGAWLRGWETVFDVGAT